MAYKQPSSIRVETELSPEEKRLVQERAKLRSALKKEYIRQLTDPHKHGEGGVLFDPAVQRFQSARASYYEYFRPTPKGYFKWMFACVIPIVAYAYLLKKDRDAFERKCRTGEIKYQDRMFKFV
ncbi:NADH dehydrogenase [ubiquinone] 1 beta subcomplex subunit 4-like [Ornithodoros turicata]|uniref:NADH dehydrogenase [ubiquinone] 1 beta subcomplex subunit 4 n=1 Tax=Ornithodoros turicata TaxID=34597 RepID=A0A2R5LFB1_9ACAR